MKRDDNSLLMLNIGCGHRFSNAPCWKNFDFTSRSHDVIACNLLRGIPVAIGSADFIYSSHVLEHFSKPQALNLLRFMADALKPGGRVRIVVPDLEDMCRNYLASLAALRDGGDSMRYRWATIELLDQMVRQTPGGLMAEIHREVRNEGDEEMRQHIIERTGFDVADLPTPQDESLQSKLARVNWPILKGKALAFYIGLVKRLLPRSLRMLIIDDTSPGEKHKWMYDRESLAELLATAGFVEVQFFSAKDSGFAPFLGENLDLNPDGTAYKRSSLYAEAKRP